MPETDKQCDRMRQSEESLITDLLSRARRILSGNTLALCQCAGTLMTDQAALLMHFILSFQTQWLNLMSFPMKLYECFKSMVHCYNQSISSLVQLL